MAIIAVYLCYKKGDWKHWKLYYPTILYYIIISINVSIITDEKPLWLFYGSSPIDRGCNYVLEFIVFPCIIILFLSNFPEQHLKQVFYLSSYILILSFCEMMFCITKEIVYYNGWNIWLSVILYIMTFPLLILHDRNPLAAWFISFLLIYGMITYFKIPINSI
ncbi:CBO0543 family protein [Caproicibacter sp. BJN0012]|uniref:CBO0543 family protein n=1 Tax=Caproicibacter sp. BJN0012 TaxID=3110227 RepID=UPI003FA4CC17